MSFDVVAGGLAGIYDVVAAAPSRVEDRRLAGVG